MTAWTWGADCPGSRASLLPADVPAVWPYVTGTAGIRWTLQQIGSIQDRGARITRVDQGSGTSGPLHADEFDVENGAWLAAGVPQIVAARRARQWSTRIYCTWGVYGDLRRVLAEAGTGRSVFYRIADWNVDEATAAAGLGGDVYAWQWASPSSNPATRLPGTDLALAEAGCDLNVVSTVIDTGWQG